MGWYFERLHFGWNHGFQESIDSLELTLCQLPVSVHGPHFKNVKQGENYSFVHPVTGNEHILTVKSIEHEELPQNVFQDDYLIYPRCITSMEYSIMPELPLNDCQLVDCAKGDSPIQREKSKLNDGLSQEGYVGIIGGADGPTSIFIAGESEEKHCHTACSSLHFHPVDSVEWRSVFYAKQREDIVVEIKV